MLGLSRSGYADQAVLMQAHADRLCMHVVAYEGRPVPNGLRVSFAKLCAKAKLTWKPAPHHTKHSAVSWMAMDGVPITQAARLVRH